MTESQMKSPPNGMNVFAMPWSDFPSVMLSGVGRELAQQRLARARERWEKIKVASEEMTQALRETYSSNARCTADYGLKVLEISNANTTSALDFLVDLVGSKSATDAYTLWTAQARKAFDTASDQNSELWALAQKLATETGEPIRQHVTRVLQPDG